MQQISVVPQGPPLQLLGMALCSPYPSRAQAHRDSPGHERLQRVGVWRGREGRSGVTVRLFEISGNIEFIEELQDFKRDSRANGVPRICEAMPEHTNVTALS